MLMKSALSILLSAAACQSAALTKEEELPGIDKEPLIGPRSPRGDWTWDAKKPGYVRMPVSRHVFNGTDKWKWGWHWSPGPGVPSGPWGWPPSGPLPGPPVSMPGQSMNPWPTSLPPWPSSLPAWPSYSLPSGYPGAYPFPTGPNYPGGWPGFPYPTGPPGSSFTTSIRQGVSTPPAQSIPSSVSTPTKAALRARATSDRRWGWQHLEDMGGIAYILQLDIGTPPQKIKVFIDTGSYELWVNPRCNTSADANLCQSYGNYYPNKSNSSNYVGGDFAVTYGTGAVKGSYWSDIMSIAMFQIPGVQFAVANDSNYTFSGILGLGYSYPYSISYPSILNLMVSQKLISAPIFSLGLGGDQDGFSEIIFGGVNRWKFAGPLEPVPIWPPISAQDPHWIQYWVNITSVGMTKPNQAPVVYTPREGFTMPTLIDTGSTLSYIREDLVALIGQQFGATVDSQGNYIVDCGYRNSTGGGTVDFGFNKGRMVINVRYKDFIYQQYPGHCMLGVQPADVGSTNYVLGDTFIRGAYLVFDQQSDVVWMNQYYNCGDGVVSVGQSARDTKNVIGAC